MVLWNSLKASKTSQAPRRRKPSGKSQDRGKEKEGARKNYEAVIVYLVFETKSCTNNRSKKKIRNTGKNSSKKWIKVNCWWENIRSKLSRAN